MISAGEKILAVVPENIAAGFRLAGIDVVETDDASILSDIVSGKGAGEGAGLLIVDDKLLKSLSRDLIKRVFSRGVPVIVPIDIPDRWHAGLMPDRYISDIIKSAVGYRLKIKV